MEQVRFYTGIPDRQADPAWHRFWVHKLAAMGRQGTHVFSRPLRYRTRRIRLPNGTSYNFLGAEEKGVDVRLALDAVRLAHRREYDVALVLSQDQGRVLAKSSAREVLACKFSGAQGESWPGPAPCGGRG